MLEETELEAAIDQSETTRFFVTLTKRGLSDSAAAILATGISLERNIDALRHQLHGADGFCEDEVEEGQDG
jgi:hypothetical protein